MDLVSLRSCRYQTVREILSKYSLRFKSYRHFPWPLTVGQIQKSIIPASQPYGRSSSFLRVIPLSTLLSDMLLQKLVYHRGRAEEHFALYSDYNNRYFNTKYCGGVDDLKKMKRGMNSHVKHFTHHDSIAQDASREYERLQQHSDLMQQQLKLVKHWKIYNSKTRGRQGCCSFH